MNRRYLRKCSDIDDVMKSSTLPDTLNGLAQKRWTGRLRVTAVKHAGGVDVFFYEGGIYSAAVDGFAPNLLARLVSAGVLNDERLAILNAEVPAAKLAASVGAECVARNWIEINALEQLHAEMVLASIGSILDLPKLKTKTFNGDVTATSCMLPKSVADVLAALETRQQRTDRLTSAFPRSANSAAAVLAIVDPGSDIITIAPEFQAFTRAVDGVASIDRASGICGLTRAEGMAIAAALVGANAAVITGSGAGNALRPPFVVPEAFGDVE